MSAVRDPLLPFSEHTQMLQSNTMSLSLVVPALLVLTYQSSPRLKPQRPSFPGGTDEG